MLPHLLSDRASLTHCAGAHAASLFVQNGCRAAGPSLEAAVPHVRQCLGVHLAPLSLLSYEEAAGAVLSAEVYSALRATRFSEDGDCEPPPPTWEVAETLEGLPPTRDEESGGAARARFWQAVTDSLLRSLSRRLFRRERVALGIDGGSGGGDVPRDVLALPARDWEVLTAPLCDCHATAASAATLAPPSVPELLARLDAQGCVSAVRADGVTLADASGDGLRVLRGVRRARSVHLVRLSNEGLLALLGDDRRCRQGSVLSLWPAAAETLAVSHCKRLHYLPLARLLQALLCAGCCAEGASSTREANDASWRNVSRELLAALGAGVGGASAERRRRLDGGYAECREDEETAASPAELPPPLLQHPRRCLRSLSLCAVVLDNAALVHVVAASLRRCRSLTSLELSHNHSPTAYLYGAAEARAERAADEACAAGEAGSGGGTDDGLSALFGHRNTEALSSRAVRDRVFGRPPRGAALPSSLPVAASQKPQQRAAMQKNPFPEMAVVGRALAACQSSGLTSLAVTYNFVTADFFEGFGRGVLPALTTLDLKGNEIFLDGRCPSGQLRGGGGDDISPPFLLQSLTQLNLSHNPLYYREEEDGSDEAVADTGRLGSFFSSFASSILRGNQGGIVRKFLKLPFTLVELDVSSSHVGLDVVVDAIVSPLPAALSTAVVPIRCLRANFCRYARVPTPGGDGTSGSGGGGGDDGGGGSSWISRLLRQTSATLQTLSLASCCLKDGDAAAFAQNLQHATALRHLSLGGNNTGLCVRLLTAPRGGLPAHSLDTLCLLNLLVSEEDLRAAPERRSSGLVRRVEVGPEACLPHHYADFLAPMLSPEECGADAALPATDVVEVGGRAGGASGANEFDIDA